MSLKKQNLRLQDWRQIILSALPDYRLVDLSTPLNEADCYRSSTIIKRSENVVVLEWKYIDDPFTPDTPRSLLFWEIDHSEKAVYFIIVKYDIIS